MQTLFLQDFIFSFLTLYYLKFLQQNGSLSVNRFGRKLPKSIRLLIIYRSYNMYFLIYSSYAVPGFKEDELKSMLVQARERNKEHLVTGLLLYFDRKFLQLIEGEKQTIKLLYNNIKNDVRHSSIVLLKEGDIDVPFFANWSMGYRSVQSHELVDEEGFKDLNSPDVLQKESALKIFKILSVIK